jgi:hypothetical protein
MPMTRGPTDPNHHAAWIACREPDRSWGPHSEPIDLRAALDEALQKGWSPKALKAYAFSWRRCDHITAAAWRTAVKWAAYDEYFSRPFLEQFNADPDRYAAFVK